MGFSDLRRRAVRAGVVVLATVTAVLAVVVGALALRGLGDVAHAYEVFEGLAVAAIAFTFVVITTPRVLRTLA